MMLGAPWCVAHRAALANRGRRSVSERARTAHPCTAACIGSGWHRRRGRRCGGVHRGTATTTHTHRTRLWVNAWLDPWRGPRRLGSYLGAHLALAGIIPVSVCTHPALPPTSMAGAPRGRRCRCRCRCRRCRGCSRRCRCRCRHRHRRRGTATKYRRNHTGLGSCRGAHLASLGCRLVSVRAHRTVPWATTYGHRQPSGACRRTGRPWRRRRWF